MNSFERFQRRNGVYKEAAEKKVNTHFIFKGYPSTTITSAIDAEKTCQAAVVHKDEQEEGYILTPSATTLEIGSVWKVKKLNLLVDHEVTIIKNVDWHKYHYLVCNLECNGWYGYFKGPEKSHIGLSLKKDTVLVSQQKPILVVAGQPLQFQDRIQIQGRGWIVNEYDSISTPGITYYSLMPSTVSKEVIAENEQKNQDVFVEKYVESTLKVPEAEKIVEDNIIEYAPNMQLSLNTEGSYFKPSVNSLKILKRSATNIVFEVPFGISEFTVDYSEKGAIKTQVYRVVK